MPSSEFEQQLLSALRRIEERIAALPAELIAAGRRGTRMDRADRVALDGLLPIISLELGDAEFTVKDLLTEAAANEELRSIRGANARQLGRLLARADGVVIQSGHRIEAVRKTRDGVLWRVDASFRQRPSSQTRAPA